MADGDCVCAWKQVYNGLRNGLVRASVSKHASVSCECILEGYVEGTWLSVIVYDGMWLWVLSVRGLVSTGWLLSVCVVPEGCCG